MRKRKVVQTEIERFSPSINQGLNDIEIKTRQEQGLVNKTIIVAGKTVWEILRTNVFTFFNILLIILGSLMIYGNVNDPSGETPWYKGLFFLLILGANIFIGLFQDIRAKALMKKMRLISTKKVEVIRNGEHLNIEPSELVLDDIMVLHSGDQISSDSIILEGNISVNESLLTGESIKIAKNPGDLVLSGTYVHNGNCIVKVEKVGKDNYAETISIKAKKFKQNVSHILKSLKKLFRILGITIITFMVVILITYASLGYFSSNESFINATVPLTGQFVAMVPAGLFLLTSFTLATGVISLFKKKANVQDLYSIEMLARTDILCVDKTGTITDGNMIVKDVIPLKKCSVEELKNIIGNIVNITNDVNQTAKALKEYASGYEEKKYTKVLSFDSKNKYSGVTFSNKITYLIGAAEYLKFDNKKEINEEINKFTCKGLRVLVIAKGKGKITEGIYDGSVEVVGLIVLQDHIKENAIETFKWFNENNVKVRVISGDNAVTVSEIAKAAGIEGAEKYVSLDGLTCEEVKEIANDYVVFGRVTPEQKEAIIVALKEAGNTVAMTGDGVNDMLALKRADCSIAMNDGAEAAKNVSHIVLLNNDFNTMPEIVAEGRRVINNLERTGSLFLVKTLFAMCMSFVFWILSISTKNEVSFPFSPNSFMVWEAFGIGISAFFISLERNPKPITKGFLRNILINAIPYSIIMILVVLTCFLGYILQTREIFYTGVLEIGFDPALPRLPRYGATGLSVLCFTGVSLMVLFNICRPVTKYRFLVVVGAVILSAGSFLFDAFLNLNLFNLDYGKIQNSELMYAAIVIFLFSALIYYIKPITNFIVHLINRKKNQNEN